MPTFTERRISSAFLSLALFLAVAASAPAATLVVANKAEATASLIDFATGAVVVTLPTGFGPHEVGISPDGHLAVVTDYGTRERPGSTLTVIDVQQAKVERTIDLGDYQRPHGIVWRSNNRHALVTAEANKALLEVDIQEGKVVAAIATDQEVSHMVATSPVGDRAFVANIGSGSITAIDLGKGERVANLATGDGAEGLAVTPDGRQVWVTNRAEDTVSVIDAKTLELLAKLEVKGFPIRAVATADGSRVLVTCARSDEVVIFDTGELRELRRLSMAHGAADTEGRLFGDRFGDSSVPIGILVTPDSKRAVVAHANADLISENDLESGKSVRLLRAGREPDGMGYSPLDVLRRPEE